MPLDQLVAAHEVVFGVDVWQRLWRGEFARVIERVANNVIVVEKFFLEIFRDVIVCSP